MTLPMLTSVRLAGVSSSVEMGNSDFEEMPGLGVVVGLDLTVEVVVVVEVIVVVIVVVCVDVATPNVVDGSF